MNEQSKIKTLTVKAYANSIECVAHTVNTIDRLVGITPTIWTKASKEADAQMDAVFMELGL